MNENNKDTNSCNDSLFIEDEFECFETEEELYFDDTSGTTLIIIEKF